MRGVKIRSCRCSDNYVQCISRRCINCDSVIKLIKFVSPWLVLRIVWIPVNRLAVRRMMVTYHFSACEASYRLPFITLTLGCLALVMSLIYNRQLPLITDTLACWSVYPNARTSFDTNYLPTLMAVAREGFIPPFVVRFVQNDIAKTDAAIVSPNLTQNRSTMSPENRKAIYFGVKRSRSRVTKTLLAWIAIL